MYTKICIQCGSPFVSAYKNRKCCSTLCTDIRNGKKKIEKDSVGTSFMKFLRTPNGLEVIDNCFGRFMAEGSSLNHIIRPTVSRTLFRFKKHGTRTDS